MEKSTIDVLCHYYSYQPYSIQTKIALIIKSERLAISRDIMG